MKDRLKNIAEKLVNSEDLVNVYKELILIFDEQCMFHEEGACMEKLWHVTQDKNLYKEIGDIFLYKVRNRDIAFAGYNRYLRFSQPEFYKSFSENLVSLGYEKFGEDDEEEDYSREIIKLCDAYDCVIYMMIALYNLKDYEGTIELEKYLKVLDKKIKEYTKTHFSEKYDCIEENNNSKRHLSEILSTTPHHNDINKLAIRLDSGNEKAYINIIGDFLTYGKYKEAMEYYNDIYRSKFQKTVLGNIVDICWKISDYYRDRYDFYSAVSYQKIALEQEVQG